MKNNFWKVPGDECKDSKSTVKHISLYDKLMFDEYEQNKNIQFKFKLNQRSVPANEINRMIGDAVSFNWTSKQPYQNLREKYGNFIHKNTIPFDPLFKWHIHSPESNKMQKFFNQLINE